MPPLGSSASRTPSRRKLARAVLLVLGLVAGAALVFLGLVGTDLWRDSRFGTRRADRWFPLTYPLLSRWAGEHREWALQALERRGYPYSQEALRCRLDSGWQPPAGWLTVSRWTELGLFDEAVLMQLVDELGERPLAEAGLVLRPLAEFIEAWWMPRQSRLVSLRLIRIAQRRGDADWLFYAPWRTLDAETASAVRGVETRLIVEACALSEPEAIRIRMAQLESGASTGDPLEGMGEHSGRLLQLIFRRFGERRFAVALQRAFAAHWGKDEHGMEAACLLLRQGDRTPLPALDSIVNRDLGKLTQMQLHPLYLEDLALAKPDSRLAVGCRAYSAIRGEGYFRDWAEPRFRYDLTLLPTAISCAKKEERCWRIWLARYPDHPGADDARWWLARTLEWQGRRCEALEVVALQLTAPLGDSAHGRGKLEADERLAACFEDRFRWLLDVGTTKDDLQRFLQRNPGHPLSTQVRYALAVRHARAHDYRAALRLTESMTIAARPPDYAIEASPCLATLTIADQRQRWQSLARHDLRTRWGRQAVTGSWLKDDGWRNGYLLLYRGQRHWGMSYAWYPSEADPHGRPDETVLRQNYRDANPNMVAWQLQQGDDSADALFDRTLALYKQWTMYPFEESAYVSGAQDPEQWFLREAEQAADDLTRRYPKSRLGSLAWWHCYNLSPRTKHLQNVIDHYPDQADWARALLPAPEEPLMQWWNRWF